MRILRMHPPLFRYINAAFNVRGKPVLFCWGETIYNPTGMNVPDNLKVHEAVHSAQQGDSPEPWWRRYIAEPSFRLNQELEAHRREWQFFRNIADADLEYPIGRLEQVAERLSSPLYGSLIGYEEAYRLIAA